MEVFEGLFHRDGANVGAGDVVFLANWSVPEGHDRVAFVFVESATGLHDEVFHHGEVFVDLSNPLFDRDFFAEGGGIFEVGKENGDSFGFAAELDLVGVFGDLVDEGLVHILAEGGFDLAFVAIGDEVFVGDCGEICENDGEERVNHVENNAAIEG